MRAIATRAGAPHAQRRACGRWRRMQAGAVQPAPGILTFCVAAEALRQQRAPAGARGGRRPHAGR
jgi:hypothetical protein